MTSAAVREAAADPLRRPLTAVERLNPAKKITMLAAGAVIAIVAVLLAFISWNGIQLFLSGYPLSLIVDPTWNPSSETNPTFGLLPFIAGTLGVMVVAAIISTPLSVGLALFMAEIAPGCARRGAEPAVEIFGGIPSVVYGWLGLPIPVPYLRPSWSGLGFTLGF